MNFADSFSRYKLAFCYITFLQEKPPEEKYATIEDAFLSYIVQLGVFAFGLEAKLGSFEKKILRCSFRCASARVSVLMQI